MEDMILEACYNSLRNAGYDTVELNPGGIYVEDGGKAYSVMVIEVENGLDEEADKAATLKE